MDDLLPHFERELALLRQHAGGFARQHPGLAAQLLISGDAGEDPHVERLFQSFALLSARVHKRLDDDFPLFTEAFLEVLYPHFLRPFPSCAIACFDLGEESEGQRFALGTAVKTSPVRGVECSFRTAYAVDLLPVRIAGVGFRGAVAAPSGTALPKTATTALSVSLELTSETASWTSLGVRSLRVYLDGEPAQVNALREALCARVQATFVQTAPVSPWSRGGDVLPRALGFADDEALIDVDVRSHAAYRLLTEYFAFPQKFNFVELPLPAALLQSEASSVTLHYLLSGLRADSDEAQLLAALDESNLRLGCTPVVNLFSRAADAITITQAGERYPLLSDGRQAFAHEVHSVDKVYWLQQTPEGETSVELQPFHSLQHGGEAVGLYWMLDRHAAVARQSPGHETALSIVDLDFNPAVPPTDTLSVDITATNRDLPSLLSIGHAGGDLALVGGSAPGPIRLLSRPTRSQRFERGRGVHWRLISHLSPNHLMFSAGGLDALKDVLRLYDLPRNSGNQRQRDGLVAIDLRPASDCRIDNGFVGLVRGTEIRLSVDEAHFASGGLRLFAQVLDCFIGRYAHTNSFMQLKLVSSRTQEELVVCPRRSGERGLI